MGKSDENGFTSHPTSPSNGTPHTTSGSNVETDEKVPCLQRVSIKIIGTLESFFARLGLSIGNHPWRYIICCIIAGLLTAIGLLAFKEVTDPDDLWVPKDAQVIADKNWIEGNFPSTIQRESIIGMGSGGDILTPSGIIALLDIYQESLTISSGSTTLSNVCIKAGANCAVYGILEVWSFDDTTIRSLSRTQILADIKATTVSPSYGNAIDYSNYLGTITRDANGDIVSAECAILTWLTDGSDSTKSATEAWESEFISLGKRGHASLANTYVFTARSWSDESGDAIQSDVLLLSVGYFIVIIFVFVVLGKFNFIEQRLWLTIGGFVCIGLAILVSIGLSSAFQQEYGPLQSVLPFLLLGVGVDDMFVIMGSLNNLSPEERALDIPQKMSKVLRHAGVSITVTSFTDFVAFMIGATTIIPALRSFCIYAGVGIIGLYIFQALLFSSCLTLDLHRMAGNRDGCCCMIKHKDDYTPNQCSQKQLVPYIFKNGLARLVTKLPYKIAVLVIGLGLFGMNIYGFSQLKQYFNPNWFIPSDSYAYAFLETSESQFPDSGASGFVYCGTLNYWSKQTDFVKLDDDLQSSSFIKNGTTDSWFSALTSWLSSTSDTIIIGMLDGNKYPTTNANFENLTYRLTTEEAVRTSSYLFFDTNFDISASRFPYQHIFLDDASTQIDAMDSTRDLVRNANLSASECFPYAFHYLTWETNKIIREELYRNLGLALICVFLVTLVLIANIFTCLLVLFGVAATLIDVAGSMHFWGLTIDTVTSIILILSIGLAVDYSAHIGHFFMTVRGTRHERAKETLGEMGPPVFFGGFSTFLAFLLLSNSNSYVFRTFFKVNFLVVLYGLFHGLIFIPVLLSWMGPKPYITAERVYKHSQQKNQNETTKPQSDAETGEGMSNNAFDGEKYIELPHVSLGSIDHNSTSRENSMADSLTRPPSQGSAEISTPPPDYSSSVNDSQQMPTVQT